MAKRHFDMDHIVKTTPNELRQAQALEYIAYYLDRIDGHLERIANAEHGEKIALTLKTIEAILTRMQ